LLAESLLLAQAVGVAAGVAVDVRSARVTEVGIEMARLSIAILAYQHDHQPAKRSRKNRDRTDPDRVAPTNYSRTAHPRAGAPAATGGSLTTCSSEVWPALWTFTTIDGVEPINYLSLLTFPWVVSPILESWAEFFGEAEHREGNQTLWCEWNPTARRVISRICVFVLIASTAAALESREGFR
jgi:hypothetical protein